MSLQIEIIRAAEFVRLGAHGQFDLAASKDALGLVAAACYKRGVERAVLDLRAVRTGPRPVFTTADLVELVNTFPHVGFSKRFRLAILYSCDPHKRARLFAFLSTLHGWTVSAFGDFEHALYWLSDASASSMSIEQASQARPVPIRSTHRLICPSSRSRAARAHVHT